MLRKKQVFTNKTGTGASSEVSATYLYRGGMVRLPVMAKLELTYGGTPTITIALQGYRLADATWIDLASATYTIGSPKYLTSDVPKKCNKYRLNISANVNVTVTAGNIGVGTVQD